MIEIKKTRPFIDSLLEPYQELIGDDFLGYRNHVYRTVTYAMCFLDYDTNAEKAVECGMAFHDIGLWTDKELAYLEPSEKIARDQNQELNLGLDPELLEGIIHWHHKIFPYHGSNERIIEACRKADWIDASKGWLKKGISRKMIAEVEAAFPNHGFHQTLLRLTKDYGGSTIVGTFRVLRGIMKW